MEQREEMLADSTVVAGVIGFSIEPTKQSAWMKALGVVWDALCFARVLESAVIHKMPSYGAIREAGFVSHRERDGKMRLELRGKTVLTPVYGTQRGEEPWVETANRDQAVLRLAAIWMAQLAQREAEATYGGAEAETNGG